MRIQRLRWVVVIGVLTLVASSVLTVHASSDNPYHSVHVRQDGRVFLGVTVNQTDDGVQVQRVVRGSPAAQAGIERGDFIVAFEGVPIEEVEQLQALIRDHAPGDTISVVIRRDGELLDLEVRFEPESRENTAGTFEPAIRGAGSGPFQMGVRFRSLTPEFAEAERLPVGEGALIEEVILNTPADDAGLEAGDIVTAVDDDKVDLEHTLSDRLYAYEAEDRVMLTVQRGDETLEIGVVLAAEHPDRSRGRAANAGPGEIRVFPNVPEILPFEGILGQHGGPRLYQCSLPGRVEFQIMVMIPSEVPTFDLPDELAFGGFRCELVNRTRDR